MARKICNGCGGYVGIDCFNPVECEWISEDIQRNQHNDRFQRIENENKKLREELNQLKNNIPCTKTTQENQ